MILSGTIQNNSITIDDEMPFVDGDKVQVICLKKPSEPKIHNAEELSAIFSRIKVETTNWKINREET